jgi:hypothetical protein
VSSAPVGRRSEYRNSASATAIKKICRSCHNRFPAGVSMAKPRETLEEDMASNTRIPKAELTGIYGAMVKRMSRKMLVTR